MPKVFPCPGCKQGFQVPDNFAGGQVRCPFCKNVVAVPKAPPISPVPPPVPTAPLLPVQLAVHKPYFFSSRWGFGVVGLLCGLLAGFLIGLSLPRGVSEPSKVPFVKSDKPESPPVEDKPEAPPVESDKPAPPKSIAKKGPKGPHDMPLTTFLATAPREPKTFTLRCQLSDYYNFDFAGLREGFYSVAMYEYETRKNFHAYTSKDSALGKSILGMLQDGKFHDLTVTVQHVGRDPSCVLLLAAKALE